MCLYTMQRRGRKSSVRCRRGRLIVVRPAGSLYRARRPPGRACARAPGPPAPGKGSVSLVAARRQSGIGPPRARAASTFLDFQAAARACRAVTSPFRISRTAIPIPTEGDSPCPDRTRRIRRGIGGPRPPPYRLSNCAFPAYNASWILTPSGRRSVARIKSYLQCFEFAIWGGGPVAATHP